MSYKSFDTSNVKLLVDQIFGRYLQNATLIKCNHDVYLLEIDKEGNISQCWYEHNIDDTVLELS